MTASNEQNRHLSRESALVARYGELMDLRELAHLLKYPSVEALRQAYYKKHLEVPLRQIPHRSGLYASTRAVSDYITGFEEGRIAR